MHGQNLKSVPDDELLRRLCALLKDSRRIEADLVAHIAEVDARRLYAREAAPSMFAYCTERLHLSEQEAYLRITVARASREYAALLAMLRDGRLHLSGIARLVPHLTPGNAETLLRRATHRSKRQIEELVAELAPRPDVAATMRKLPSRRVEASLPVSPQLGPDRVECPALNAGDAGSGRGGLAPEPGEQTDSKTLIQPLSPSRYRVQFTARAELREKLERLQALMRSSVPDGDLATIVEQAVTEKLERLEARRFAKTKSPRKVPPPTRAKSTERSTRPRSRYIPAVVRRTVEERDGGRCTYRDALGRQCTGRHDLEFHHRTPFGRGGEHSVRVLTLMCPTHNALMAERDYGKEVMARFRGRVRPGVDASRHG